MNSGGRALPGALAEEFRDAFSQIGWLDSGAFHAMGTQLPAEIGRTAPLAFVPVDGSPCRPIAVSENGRRLVGQRQVTRRVIRRLVGVPVSHRTHGYLALTQSHLVVLPLGDGDQVDPTAASVLRYSDVQSSSTGIVRGEEEIEIDLSTAATRLSIVVRSPNSRFLQRVWRPLGKGIALHAAFTGAPLNQETQSKWLVGYSSARKALVGFLANFGDAVVAV
jgi:hypothetical protein